MLPIESHNPCEMLGNFQYIRIPPFYEELIQSGIKELNELHKQHYNPLERGREAKIEASLQGEQLFVFAADRSRPTFYQLMVITGNGDVFLPETKADHFYKVVDLLNTERSCLRPTCAIGLGAMVHIGDGGKVSSQVAIGL